MNRLMRVKEVSDYLQLSEATIYRLIALDKIPHIQIGHLHRIRLEDLNEWLKSKSIQINS